MSFGRYRLMSQLSAGRDGVRYRASDRHDGSIVEMILLAEARIDEARWSAISRRLRRALMIAHASSRRILGLDMDGETAFVVLDWIEGPTLALLGREEGEAIGRTIELALGLPGSPLGLAHGRIAPGLIVRSPSKGLVLDWTGLDVDAQAATRAHDSLDDSCQAPELAKGART